MNIFKFGHINLVYLFILIPILVLIYFLYLRWKKSIINKMGNPQVIKKLYPEFSVIKQYIKFSLLILSFIF